MYIPDQATAEAVAENFGTPTYITDANTLRNRVKEMNDAFKETPTQIFYAVKANYNPSILRTLKEAGVYGIDCVSPFEVELAKEIGFTSDQIIFTGIASSDEELKFVGDAEVVPNIGSLSELKRFAEMFPGREISIRFSPNIGLGEFDFVQTGGSESKFGIVGSKLDAVHEITKKHKITISGLHMHLGSGFYDSDAFDSAVELLAHAARRFPDVRSIDVGGGFGVRYRVNDHPLDLPSFAKASIKHLKELEKDMGREIVLRVEPGKFLVSESTVLLVRATMLKEKGPTHFAGVDAGFNTLLRPAMYGAYHEIINVSNPNDESERYEVVGNVCETGDIFNRDISMPNVREGDLLAILTAGGYGSAMSSNYNLRPFAAEVLVDGDETTLTRKRQTYDDIMQQFC